MGVRSSPHTEKNNERTAKGNEDVGHQNYKFILKIVEIRAKQYG